MRLITAVATVFCCAMTVLLLNQQSVEAKPFFFKVLVPIGKVVLLVNIKKVFHNKSFLYVYILSSTSTTTSSTAKTTASAQGYNQYPNR